MSHICWFQYGCNMLILFIVSFRGADRLNYTEHIPAQTTWILNLTYMEKNIFFSHLLHIKMIYPTIFKKKNKKKKN